MGGSHLSQLRHLTDDQLILYHYGEVKNLLAVGEHLASCNSCHARYQDLERVLAAVDALPLPQRAEAYGTEVWRRLRPQLPDRAEIRASFFDLRRWVVAGAVAALVLVAFQVGRFWPEQEIQLVSQPGPEQVMRRILLLEVGEHLERSQIALVEFINAQTDELVDISVQQARVRELVAANRIYRQAAGGGGEMAMSSLLEDLERVLLEIENSPSKLTPAELDQIRQHIVEQGILFKIRVIATRLGEREKAAARDLARRSL